MQQPQQPQPLDYDPQLLSESDILSSEGESVISEHPPNFPAVIANYIILEKLGSGYSGSIFKARHLTTGAVVALKLQWVQHENPTNKKEGRCYPLLHGGIGIPRLHAKGIQGPWDYLAIDLLGDSLDSIYRRSGQDTFDLRSVCSVAIQVITRLKFMHSRGLLHRDIQLGNVVIGLPPNQRMLYMIDFGFSGMYIDPHTGRHVPDSKIKRDFIGNYWFSSINVHCRGKVPSRRDDLEAAGLMFIHLLTPRGLSWTRNGVPKSPTAHARLKTAKRKGTPESLCRGLPPEFEEFLSYTRGLGFKDNPDYDKWARRFQSLAIDEGFTNVDEFIWPPPPIPKTAVAKNVNTPQRIERPPVRHDDMTQVLHDLARLQLAPQLGNILLDRTNVQREAVPAAAPLPQQVQAKPRVIALPESESDELEGESIPIRFQESKAVRLRKLSYSASGATDNPTLATLIREFGLVLQMNSSRTLTREATHFLDVVHKQLDDPSVFVAPAGRNSRQNSHNDQLLKDPAHVKLGVVARLKREVGICPNNKALAALVSEFTNVTLRSTGRTLTKDGFAFLEGLADRLKALS